jgi:hypothetical protein
MSLPPVLDYAGSLKAKDPMDRRPGWIAVICSLSAWALIVGGTILLAAVNATLPVGVVLTLWAIAPLFGVIAGIIAVRAGTRPDIPALLCVFLNGILLLMSLALLGVLFGS